MKEQENEYGFVSCKVESGRRISVVKLHSSYYRFGMHGEPWITRPDHL